MDEISSKLGYRIVITSAQISPNEFIPVQDLSYSISFENRGYSRPLHDYRFKLRFISSNGVECVMEDSSVDLSSWYASDTETYTEDYMGQEATITENFDMTLNCTRQ